MRQFSILRYLKKFSLLIFLLSVIGSLFIYFYARSQQRYVASTVIQYTNSAAKEGYTPDGSPLNVEEIYSSTVIDAAMADLGFHSNIDSVRSNCYVEEVIPETRQKLNEALVEKGEDPSYVTDTYRVYFIGKNDTGEDYAWNMLDAIIKNYYEFYAEKYVEEPLQGNGAAVLAEGNYDYMESAQILEDSISEMLDYLLSKREDYPYFRSVETGYSYNDLYRIYHLLYNYEIPDLYASILTDAETNDIDLMKSRLIKDCEDLQLYIGNRRERANSLKKLIENYSIRNKEMMDYHYQSAENGTESILKDVEYNHEHSNKETTYDGLIQEYVDLNIDVRQKTIEKEHKEYLLSVFETEDHAQGQKTFSSEEIREKINHCANLANKYYQYVKDTGTELNRQLSANYLAMISSINVQPTVNIKLYLALAIILFVLVGGVGAVLLGRMLDFIDYFRYVDKTVQIPNRARCDVYISEWANKLLDENFACVALKMDSLSSLSNEYGREAGDEVLKDFAAILKSYGDLYGFVGHNGSGVFYAFFPKCPPDKLDVILKAIGRQVEKYNNLNQGHTVHYISGKAVSSEDHIFEIRDLLRLALQRMHSEQNEAESEDVSGKNAPEKTRNRTKPVSAEKKNDAQ